MDFRVYRSPLGRGLASSGQRSWLGGVKMGGMQRCVWSCWWHCSTQSPHACACACPCAQVSRTCGIEGLGEHELVCWHAREAEEQVAVRARHLHVEVRGCAAA